ncbi:MAG: hypothetical protein HZC28_16240 [Spirochaetes bacterium]|nr:hypothetical protein [Spirochaetota bacterium]
MYIGILIAIGTGLLWTFIGIIMSRCSRSKIEFIDYYAANTLFTAVLTMLVYVRWNVAIGGQVMEPLSLTTVIISSGIANAAGLIVMQRAMNSGHNGVIWAVGQSALIIPFISGIVLFGEHAAAIKFLGVGMILIGMLVPSILGGNNVEGNRMWLVLTFAAFILFGIGQTLQSVPSYWRGWIDNANIRPTLGSAGAFAGALVISLFRGRLPIPDRRTLLLALGMAALNTVSVKLFYVALDMLSKQGMASICFPLIVGSCIVGFSMYSLFVIREKSRWFNWAGLAATITGIVAISR